LNQGAGSQGPASFAGAAAAPGPTPKGKPSGLPLGCCAGSNATRPFLQVERSQDSIAFQCGQILFPDLFADPFFKGVCP